ncbi:MAG: hypothetical protein ACEPOW_14435 [Bacteroidales bacterium]
MFEPLLEIFMSSSFLNMLAISIVLGGMINVISYSFSLLFIKQISRSKSFIFVFAVGLFLLFSLSPVLKVLVLKKIFTNNIVLTAGVYVIHLLPLYTLIYLFSFSFIDTNFFSYAKCQKVKYWYLFQHFRKKMMRSLLIFWNFATIFILFDNSKDLVNSSLFSFQELHNVTASYILELSPVIIDLIKIIPIVLLLIPSFIVSLFIKSNIQFSSDISNLSVFIPTFYFPKRKNKGSKRKLIRNQFENGYVLGGIPILLYITFTLFFIDLSKIDWVFLFKTFLSCSFISIITVYIFLGVCFILNKRKKTRLVISYVLFIFALLPGEIIGAFVNLIGLTNEWNIKLVPLVEIQSIIGFILFYGIFPFFFINLSLLESEDTLRVGQNYKLSILKQINLLLKVNYKGIILSLLFFAILICNDSIITSSIDVSDMENRSIAFKISSLIRNPVAFDNFLPILLIIANFLLIVFSPFYNRIMETVGLLPIRFSDFQKIK